MLEMRLINGAHTLVLVCDHCSNPIERNHKGVMGTPLLTADNPTATIRFYHSNYDCFKQEQFNYKRLHLTPTDMPTFILMLIDKSGYQLSDVLRVQESAATEWQEREANKDE